MTNLDRGGNITSRRRGGAPLKRLMDIGRIKLAFSTFSQRLAELKQPVPVESFDLALQARIDNIEQFIVDLGKAFFG